jgi:hypothetical protein
MNKQLGREDIWYALSDLYLDDDLGNSGYKYIASVLAETYYSIDEIESILFMEVHPAFYWNLKQVAGHWGDFGREWAIEAVTNHLNKPKPKSWLQKLLDKGLKKEQENLKSIVLPAWQEVRSHLTILRSGDRQNA